MLRLEVIAVDGPAPNEACPSRLCFYRVNGDTLLLRRHRFAPPYDRVDVLPDEQPGSPDASFDRWYRQLFSENRPVGSPIVQVSEDLELLAERCDRILQDFPRDDDGVFVKFATQQTEPARNGREIVQLLCRSTETVFLVPWNADIYRLFVYAGQIRTVCAVRESRPFCVLATAVNELQRVYVDRLLPHPCCALDVYLHDDRLHVIEVKPWYSTDTGLTTYQQIVDTPRNVCRYFVRK